MFEKRTQPKKDDTDKVGDSIATFVTAIIMLCFSAAIVAGVAKFFLWLF